MDTEPILVPIIPTPYSPKLTCLKNFTQLDDEIEQYIEEEIFRPDRKIPLRTAKCVLVGPSSCGKTSLISRLGHNGHIMFNERSPSMRIDYWIQDFEVFRVPFKLQIWDTIGSETVSKSFYRDAQAIMILFDLTKMDTLEEIKRYAEDILRSDPEEQLVFLIGCKKDLLSEAQCRTAEKQLEPILNELYAEYWPVSALTGKNVQPLFSRVAALSFLRIIHTEIEVMESFRREAITLNSSDQPEMVKKKRRSCLRCLLI